jgi:hypothetical protein
MDFKQFITEAPEKSAAFAFGRFNPPTVGHEKLINKVKSVADEHNATAHIVASHSEGTSKDPLPAKAKVGYLKHVAPEGTKVSGATKESPTFLHAASKLHSQGYKHLVMVAGSDRTEEYNKTLNKYNGVAGKHGHYNFKSIKVVSAGQRDPDAEGVEGMSGTKMRAHARAGEMKQFKSGLPKALHPHADEIVSRIKAVPVKEDFENPVRFDWGTPEGTDHAIGMTPEMKIVCPVGEVFSKDKGMCVPVRESYIAGEIFKLDYLVESTNGTRGKIVYRGSSYVTIQQENGDTSKHWLKDIQEIFGEKEGTGLHVDLRPKLSKTSKLQNFKKFSDGTQEKEKIKYKGAYKPTYVEGKQIPALFLSKEQLAEMSNSRMEVTFDGYTTSFIHTCPGASAQLKELITRVELPKKYVLQAIMATDQYLEIEKEAKAKGFADQNLIHDFNMKFAIAHDTMNILGVEDKDLLYMQKHLKAMSDLNMHKDGTYANEPGSTVTVVGAGGVEEDVASADFKYIPSKDPITGEVKYVKHRARMIDTSTKERPKTLSSIRQSQKDKDEETKMKLKEASERDVNFNDNKDVFHGIDKPIDGQGHPDKPVGMVSFKSFMQDPQNQAFKKYHENDRQEVHAAQVEIAGQKTAAYKMMKKAKQVE